jgi:hypothetical protein
MLITLGVVGVNELDRLALFCNVLYLYCVCRPWWWCLLPLLEQIVEWLFMIIQSI